MSVPTLRSTVVTSRAAALIASGCAIALTAPAATAAAAPWSDPVAVAPAAARVASPDLQLAGPAGALLTWRMLRSEPTTLQAPATDRAVVATRAPDGTLATRTLRDDVVAQVSCGSGCVAVLRQRDVARRRVELRVSIGSGARRLGRLHTLARYLPPGFSELARADTPVIAAHRSGAVAVAWIDRGGRRVRVALRRPGAPFGRPRTVAAEERGSLHLPRIVFHSRNAVTVAYVREALVGGRRRRAVEARRVVGSRGTIERAQVVGPAPESYVDLRLAASRGGRAVIAWGNVHGTVMGFEDRWIVRASLRAAGASRFGQPQVLDPGAVKAPGAPGEVGVGVAADGTATVAWSAHANDIAAPATAQRAATARPGRRFGPSQLVGVTQGYGGLADLAVAPSGAAIMTWATFGAPTAIVAAVRAPGAPAFGAPELVSALRTSVINPVDPTPDADIDDNGAASVVWGAEQTTASPPVHVPMSAVVLRSTRAAGGR